MQNEIEYEFTRLHAEVSDLLENHLELGGNTFLEDFRDERVLFREILEGFLKIFKEVLKYQDQRESLSQKPNKTQVDFQRLDKFENKIRHGFEDLDQDLAKLKKKKESMEIGTGPNAQDEQMISDFSDNLELLKRRDDEYQTKKKRNADQEQVDFHPRSIAGSKFLEEQDNEKGSNLSSSVALNSDELDALNKFKDYDKKLHEIFKEVDQELDKLILKLDTIDKVQDENKELLDGLEADANDLGKEISAANKNLKGIVGDLKANGHSLVADIVFMVLLFLSLAMFFYTIKRFWFD